MKMIFENILWKKLRRWVVLGAFVFGQGACDYDWQEPPMANSKFAQVYIALLHATAGDSLTPAQADSVLQTQQVSRSDFEAASRYYSDKAERWAEILKLVVAQLDSQANLRNPKPK